MPPIKLSQIISFTSEDPKYPSENLIKSGTSMKWKCASGNNDKQSVTIKFEKLSSIQSIDIGNDGSAFIEILASRDDAHFEVILVASSFMSPLESRNGTELNRVRMFTSDKLNKLAKEQKWDRIKVVCSQPFNKSLQCGVSFIKLIAPGQILPDDTINIGKQFVTKLGNFNLKDEDDACSSLSVGSFFAKRKEVKDVQIESTVISSIRAASSAIANSPSPSKKSIKRVLDDTPRPSKVAKYSSDNLNSSSLLNLPSNTQQGSASEKEKNNKSLENNYKRNSFSQKNDNQSSSNVNQVSKNSSASPSSLSYCPFNKLMKGIEYMFSGYQNPLRSQLRDKMTEMGAKCSSDWSSSTTHLICAFTNTPKFKALKGKVKIVSHKWVEDCHKNKKKYPWRRYDLEKSSSPESDEEIWADEIKPKKEYAEKVNENTEDQPGDYNEETDTSSGSKDTDDEIESILNEQKNGPSVSNGVPAPCSTSKDDADFDDDTDIDSDVDEMSLEQQNRTDTSRIDIPELPTFFDGRIFFLYGRVITEDSKRLANRLIVAYGGTVSNYMSSNVNFVITEDIWGPDFEEALEDNDSLQFVKPQWIWLCHTKQALKPHQRFLVVPN